MSHSATEPVRCCVVSLGCPKNLVDSEQILAGLIRSGLDLTNRPDRADVIVVNTCGFLSDAVIESLREIRRLARWKHGGRCKALIAVGCLVSRFPDLVLTKVPDVDACLPSGRFHEVPALVARLLGRRPIRLPKEPPYPERVLSTPPWYAYLKIAEGCDRTCSFCTIPMIRGRQKSRPVDDLYDEAVQLVRSGVRELILIAQDTTLYGVDLYGRQALPDLIKALDSIDGLNWFRILYAYPNGVTDEIIDALASSRTFARYLDLPFQHSHKEILQAMRRGGDGDQFLRRLHKLRESIPGIAIRTTFIVGFPGEKDHHFEHLMDFVCASQVDHMGVFLFSPEKGTAAAEMPDQVLRDVAVERRQRLMALQKEISERKNQQRIGTVIEAVVEEPQKDGRWVGRACFQAPEIDGHLILFSRNGQTAQPGQFVKAQVVKAKAYDLEGRVLF